MTSRRNEALKRANIVSGDNLKHPNIVLIVIDALRARNLGCYGGNADSSPNIDKIAEDSILFENCYSCSNTTDQSLTSIFTGRYPRSHGIIHHGDKVTPDDLKTFENLNVKLISEILQTIGYRSYAIDWMARWFRKGFDFYGYRWKQNIFQKLTYAMLTLPLVHIRYLISNLGLLKIYAKKRQDSLSSFFKGLNDVLNTFRFTFELARTQDAAYITKVADHIIPQIKNDKFFLFIHYWDTHSPYHCPKKKLPAQKARMSSTDFFLEKYQGAVSYVDAQIGHLMGLLKEFKLLENLLIIITSDHGESLTEHDIMFDHHGLYEVTTHVPLILYYPKIFTNAKRINGLVQHTDLVPTLNDLLGIGQNNFKFDGKSMIPLIRGNKEEIREYVFFEESYVQEKIGLRSHNFKYIYAPDGKGVCKYCRKVHAGVEEFYDLENDPEEANNSFDDCQAKATKMKIALLDLVRSLDEKTRHELQLHGIRRKAPKYMTDERELEQIHKKLKSLGYKD
jgi:arylsulfatase